MPVSSVILTALALSFLYAALALTGLRILKKEIIKDLQKTK
jgi:hypothetical protein